MHNGIYDHAIYFKQAILEDSRDRRESYLPLHLDHAAEDAQSLFRGDYSGNLDNTIIDETCRSKMCEWIFHVIDSTRLQHETASVAMNFLDRFLCASTPRAKRARSHRSEYQLAGEFRVHYYFIKVEL